MKRLAVFDVQCLFFCLYFVVRPSAMLDDKILTTYDQSILYTPGYNHAEENDFQRAMPLIVQLNIYSLLMEIHLIKITFSRAWDT